MHAHIVLAHPEVQSFNAHMAKIAYRSLVSQGWSVSLSYGVEAGLRYSDASIVEARLDRIDNDFADALGKLDQRPVVPFNRMAEWDRMDGLWQSRLSIHPLSDANGIWSWNEPGQFFALAGFAVLISSARCINTRATERDT